MRRVCVYCGSSAGADPAFARAARELGSELARLGLGLVYGGGNVGLMGIVADAALAGGGEVVGVIPEDLVRRELAHEGLTERHVVAGMHERKQLMSDLADGFIALPGGFGTLDELMEAITWRQLGYHGKPCGVLNVSGYYDHLLAFVEHAVQAGLIRPQHRELILVGTTPAGLLARMQVPPPPPAEQTWLRSP